MSFQWCQGFQWFVPKLLARDSIAPWKNLWHLWNPWNDENQRSV
jgi:hypothetical protein